MKKRWILLLLLLVPLLARAEEGMTLIDPEADRGIVPLESAAPQAEEGISPTTGLTLSDLEVPEGFGGLAATGRYMPALVQIDNTYGGVKSNMPWGVMYADIVYEMPLYRQGYTRLTCLFSDRIPNAVGPVRSARVGHAWLREEWDCAFLHYGGQKKSGSNVYDEFKKLGVKSGELRFDGLGGAKAWSGFFQRIKGPKAPHNVSVDAASVVALVPEEHQAAEHAFSFTDAVHLGDSAATVVVDWNSTLYSSTLIWDEAKGGYLRYMHRDDGSTLLWADRFTGESAAFANVIVQFTRTTYNSEPDAPITHLVGEGNADYFMNGMHIAGYWKRESMDSRTVYYGPDGREISLSRGKTLIIVLPPSKKVSYQ